MPTVVKSSSNIAKVGDLSTYTVNTAATPYDTADTSGSVPTVALVLANGVDTDYLIAEDLSIEGPAIGKYQGKVIDLSSSSNSGRYSLTAETIISRLNSEQRVYPTSPYSQSDNYVPRAALEYWSQQCGVFYDNVPGDVLLYQSQYIHLFAFVKGSTRPAQGYIYITGTGESNHFSSSGDRWAITFGADRDERLDLKIPLAVRVPVTSDPRVVVFSSAVTNSGTGSNSKITWNFTTTTGTKLALRAVIDNANGISMESSEDGTAFTSRGVIAAAKGAGFRFNLGITSASATTTKFTLNAIDNAGNVVGTVTSTATSKLAGALSLTNITYRGEAQNVGTTQSHCGDFISIMAAMPTVLPVVQKSLGGGTVNASFFSGFSGNVWEKMKEYCSIYRLDISCVNGVFTVGPRATSTVSSPTIGELSKRINTRDSARFVEVTNQNSVSTVSGTSVTPRVMWKADTVYQVAVGETQEFNVQTGNSILDLQQPVAVSGINPFPYVSGAGQYVVTGSDGYIVSPSFWRDQGGKITVDTTDNDGEIKVTIKGPDFDSPRAPYRISEGDAGRPALYVTGNGVINNPVKLKVSTGNTKAAKEIGVTIESPFISSTVLAYDAAARASRAFATPEVIVSFSEALAHDKPSNLGTVPAGQLIRSDGNILRITDAQQTTSGVSGTAVQNNTIALVKGSFPSGTTIGQAKTFYAGKTIGQTNLKPLKVVK